MGRDPFAVPMQEEGEEVLEEEEEEGAQVEVETAEVQQPAEVRQMGDDVEADAAASVVAAGFGGCGCAACGGCGHAHCRVDAAMQCMGCNCYGCRPGLWS